MYGTSCMIVMYTLGQQLSVTGSGHLASRICQGNTKCMLTQFQFPEWKIIIHGIGCILISMLNMNILKASTCIHAGIHAIIHVIYIYIYIRAMFSHSVYIYIYIY